jgi:sugar/nucleoside kinase (ribokinase family)
MIKLLVAGTVAYDSIETPFGKVENVLGGSALHFTNAASFFTDVGIVATVGKDFNLDDIAFLKERNVDMTGLEVDEKGKTFRWAGKYNYDLNQAITLKTELNVIENFKPKVPEKFRNAEFLFLANIDPELQAHVISQVHTPTTIVLDTMNFWIESKFDRLMDVIEKVHMLIINEGELREITKEHNLVKGARKLMARGPSCIVVKRGEYGTRKSFSSRPHSRLKMSLIPQERVIPSRAGSWGILPMSVIRASIRSNRPLSWERSWRLLMWKSSASTELKNWGIVKLRNGIRRSRG